MRTSEMQSWSKSNICYVKLTKLKLIIRWTVLSQVLVPKVAKLRKKFTQERIINLIDKQLRRTRTRTRVKTSIKINQKLENFITLQPTFSTSLFPSIKSLKINKKICKTRTSTIQMLLRVRSGASRKKKRKKVKCHSFRHKLVHTIILCKFDLRVRIAMWVIIQCSFVCKNRMNFS